MRSGLQVRYFIASFSNLKSFAAFSCLTVPTKSTSKMLITSRVPGILQFRFLKEELSVLYW